MSKTRRGPKIRSAKNSPPTLKGFIRHMEQEPTSPLRGNALAEFQRLVGVLEERGTLERIDLAIPTECARVKGCLDDYYAAQDTWDEKTISIITKLTAQRRGLLREMGLTTIPSRSVIHQRPTDRERDPISSLIKIS